MLLHLHRLESLCYQIYAGWEGGVGGGQGPQVAGPLIIISILIIVPKQIFIFYHFLGAGALLGAVAQAMEQAFPPFQL
jgi:hypothetical protein